MVKETAAKVEGEQQSSALVGACCHVLVVPGICLFSWITSQSVACVSLLQLYSP